MYALRYYAASRDSARRNGGNAGHDGENAGLDGAKRGKSPALRQSLGESQ